MNKIIGFEKGRKQSDPDWKTKKGKWKKKKKKKCPSEQMHTHMMALPCYQQSD